MRMTVSALWALSVVALLTACALQRADLPTVNEPPPPLIVQPVSVGPSFDGRPIVRWFGERFRENVDGTWEHEDGTVWRPQRAATTAYTWTDGRSVEPGVTAGRTCAKTTYGVATDWRALPRGAVVWVPGYGRHRVDDKCGAAEKDWNRSRAVRVDLRIPNLGPSGVWRDNATTTRIARQHGYQGNRIILVRVA